MTNPDWKATLAASAISMSIVFGLGYLYIWAAGL
jgi:hypothetical protein